MLNDSSSTMRILPWLSPYWLSWKLKDPFSMITSTSDSFSLCVCIVFVSWYDCCFCDVIFFTGSTSLSSIMLGVYCSSDFSGYFVSSSLLLAGSTYLYFIFGTFLFYENQLKMSLPWLQENLCLLTSDWNKASSELTIFNVNENCEPLL